MRRLARAALVGLGVCLVGAAAIAVAVLAGTLLADLV